MRESLPALLMLCRREFELTVRAPSFRWPVVALMLLAVAVGLSEPQSAATAAYSVHHMLGPWFGFLALFWATAAAARDQWGKTEPIVLSKPTAVEGFVAARFLGTFLATLLGLTLVLAAGIAAQAGAAGRVPSLLALALRLPAALPGLFYLAALGFTMTLLLRSPLAAAAVGLYWILVLLATDYVARVFNVTLPQNGTIYACAAIAVVLLGILFYRRRDRARSAWTPLLAGATVAAFAAALGAAVALEASSHDRPLHEDELSIRMGGQSMQPGLRTPGFWLPDQNGRKFGLHLADDRILVIAFWSPESPESMPVLGALEQVQQQFGGRGVTPVAVCLTEDHSASPFFARVDGLDYRMVTDTGTRWSNQLDDTSPVGQAYQIKLLPFVVLTDRERRVRKVLNDPSQMTPEALSSYVYTLLRAEPS